MIARVPNYPDYTWDGSKAIPLIISGKILEKFYPKTIATQISSTDYIGEIKDVGDRVYIRSYGNITIKPYQKGMKLELEYPETGYISLAVDRAYYFNFGIDAIDLHQMDIDWIPKFSEDAAMQLKIIVDREMLDYIWTKADPHNYGANAGKYSQSFNLGTLASPITLNRNNVLDYIIHCETVLDQQDIPEDNRYIIVPSEVWNIINRSDLRQAYWSGLDRSTFLMDFSGYRIGKFNIFVSNLLPRIQLPNNEYGYRIIFGRKNATVFVAQINKTEVYSPPDTFAKAVKGLMVYGFDVVYPQMIGYMVAKVDLS